MLKEITDFAEEISREAGSLLLSGFRSDTTEISYKSRTNLVTNMDRASEEFLFNAVNDRFPKHSIIAEEGSRKDTADNFTWYIDPLDATNNYAHGLPIFCVSIGIYSRELDRVAAGVIYDPLHDELFRAHHKGGAFLNGNPISVSGIDEMGISVLATGFPYEKEDPEKNNLKQFINVLPNVQGMRRMGSAAIDLAYVACGRLDGYWEPELQPWDMAAGAIIVEEAGGTVTAYNGRKFDPEIAEIIATNGKIHISLIDILASV